MARDNDAMLVEACLHGDRHAFDKLVDRYEGPLFSAAYRITGSVNSAMVKIPSFKKSEGVEEKRRPQF